eukprot:767754-Amphidinium_carterae.1
MQLDCCISCVQHDMFELHGNNCSRHLQPVANKGTLELLLRHEPITLLSQLGLATEGPMRISIDEKKRCASGHQGSGNNEQSGPNEVSPSANCKLARPFIKKDTPDTQHGMY